VLIASIQCHHADTGGGMRAATTRTRPTSGRGVRFPALKLYERGVERRDLTYFMRVNNRTPTFLGDLRAQVGAAQLGVRRLQEVLARHGTATVRRAVEEMIELAARRFREEVRRWPDGVYASDVYVDHDPKGNPDIHLHCTVTVAGERLKIDFTGSDARPEIQAYSSFGNTRGYVVAQLASMMDPAIPKNEGFFRSIELVVPEGCCLNPPPGRSVAAGSITRAPRSARRSPRRSSRSSPTAAARRSTRSACRRSSRHRSAHRAALHRQLCRHDRRPLQCRPRPGRLGLDERELSGT